MTLLDKFCWTFNLVGLFCSLCNFASSFNMISLWVNSSSSELSLLFCLTDGEIEAALYIFDLIIGDDFNWIKSPPFCSNILFSSELYRLTLSLALSLSSSFLKVNKLSKFCTWSFVRNSSSDAYKSFGSFIRIDWLISIWSSIEWSDKWHCEMISSFWARFLELNE